MPVPACGIWAPSENGDASGGSVGGQRLCGAFTRGRAAAPREPARAQTRAQTRARRPRPWPRAPWGQPGPVGHWRSVRPPASSGWGVGVRRHMGPLATSRSDGLCRATRPQSSPVSPSHLPGELSVAESSFPFQVSPDLQHLGGGLLRDNWPHARLPEATPGTAIVPGVLR